MSDVGRALSIREIARRTGVPESTLRYYRSVFPEFIPTVGCGRNRRHPMQAVAVFQRIAGLFAAGESRATVRRELEESIPGGAGRPPAGLEPPVEVARQFPVERIQPDGQLQRPDLERLLTAMMVRDRELISMHRELLELLEGLIRALGSLAGARGWQPGGRLEPAIPAPRAESEPAASADEPTESEALELEQLRESLVRERATIERLRRARLELERRLARLEKERKQR